MRRISKGSLVVMLAFVLGAGAMLALNLAQPSVGQAGEGEKPATGARYAVIETEGHNLIVTDNKTNVLYFYAVDKGQPVGSDMKLRGSIDLKQVGQAVITPKKINIQRKD